MKIMTILGTRPEIIRLSLLIPLLDKLCEHTLVHTGQNYDKTLNELFFSELGVRPPDYLLDCRASGVMEGVGKILTECEKVLQRVKPDRLLLLGDTNSALSAIAAKRMGIPVFHMEAGNRCFDDRVPEEVNRRIVDHCSDVLLPYTERSRANLLREGISGNRIYVTGNPIYEVLTAFSDRIEQSGILEQLALQKGKFFLVTLHRAENVDVPERLANFLEALYQLHDVYRMPVVCSLHPRMRSQLEKQGKTLDENKILAVDPLGLFDFVHLEKTAFCVLSDSGTVQEECCIYQVPNITLRDVTERPETLEVGSNFIAGSSPEMIVGAVKAVAEQDCTWTPPREYTVNKVSVAVSKILLGYYRN